MSRIKIHHWNKYYFPMFQIFTLTNCSVWWVSFNTKRAVLENRSVLFWFFLFWFNAHASPSPTQVSTLYIFTQFVSFQSLKMKKTSPSLKAYPRIYLTSDNFMKRSSDQIKLKEVIWVWREFSDLKKQLTSTFLKSGKRKSVSLFLESEFRLLTTKVRVQEHEVLNWARLVIILTPYHFPDFSWEFWLVFTVKSQTELIPSKTGFFDIFLQYVFLIFRLVFYQLISILLLYILFLEIRINQIKCH